jgi:outer membrane protein OmpA-like peptidoglycan-associated protein
MKNYISIVALSLCVGWTGMVAAEMNGNLLQTPAWMPAPVAGALPQFDRHGAPKLAVAFQSSHADIPPSFTADLNRFGRYLKSHPQSRAEIRAYADLTGRAPANAALSQKRADAVRNYLVQNFGISADRVTAFGCGEVSDKIQNITEAAKQADRQALGAIYLSKA